MHLYEVFFFDLAYIFQGFVMSNWRGIDKITSPPHSNYSYSVQAGVSAGIDMVHIIDHELDHMYIVASSSS